MIKSGKIIWVTLSLLITSFSLSGCSVNGEKTASFSLLYGTALFFSFVIPICYILTVKNKNPWIMLLFLCIITVNSGYLMLCLSKTLSFALWANRIAYFGSVFLPLCMLMSVLRLCNIKYKKNIAYLLFAVGILVFLIAASQGYSDIYYKSVSLSIQNGVSRLIKEYGPLHIIYLFYLLLHFVIMIAVMIYARVKGKLSSTLRAIFLITAVFINITVWLLEQLVNIDFELLSFSYITSEAFLLGLSLLIQENEKRIEAIMKDNSRNECPTFTEEEISYFKRGITELTKTEKIIFDYYILGHSTKEIREKMNITENTLKYHNKNIYGKLGVTSRKQLVLINEFIQK
ncbi:MAG: hypothetical protein IJ946_08805 [Clostridia bacterium]|nr:hypothetical protein [Clostridia bacterium]